MNMSLVLQLLKRKLFSDYNAFPRPFYKRCYSRKRNQTGTYGPYKIVKADNSCDDSGNLNHVNNINWELFASNGYPFFMPGNVGPAWQNTETSESFIQIVPSTVSNQQLYKVNNTTENNDKLITVNNNTSEKNNPKINDNNNKNDDVTQQQLPQQIKNKLSCIINECPMVLRKGVVELFGGTSGRTIDLRSSILTVITLVQHPINLYQFNDNQDIEIEKLAKNFVLAAQDICMTLTVMGYWADFINPFSGKPYLSHQQSPSTSSIHQFNNSTTHLYDTDQRFRCLDFQIVQQNNCTIIKNEKQLMYDCDDCTDNDKFISSVDTSSTSTTATTSGDTTPDNNPSTSYSEDTFIGNLFTNAPHNIGYLLDIKSQLM